MPVLALISRATVALYVARNPRNIRGAVEPLTCLVWFFALVAMSVPL